jgi:hypothetical protein
VLQSTIASNPAIVARGPVKQGIIVILNGDAACCQTAIREEITSRKKNDYFFSVAVLALKNNP